MSTLSPNSSILEYKPNVLSESYLLSGSVA